MKKKDVVIMHRVVVSVLVCTDDLVSVSLLFFYKTQLGDKEKGGPLSRCFLPPPISIIKHLIFEIHNG